MIRTLLTCVREYKKESLLAPIFVSLEVVMETVIPLLMASLIDSGIEKQNMSHILLMGGLLVVSALISMLFGACSGNYAAKASAGFAKNLRKDLYYRIQNFSFANIDKYSTSGIVTRLTTDVTNVQNAYQMLIRIAVRAPIMLIFALIMAFSLNARLSLIFLCVAPVLAIGLAVIMRFSFPILQKVFSTYDTLNNVVQENIAGIRVVKSFVREKEEKKKFGSVSELIYQRFCKGEKMIAFNMPLMQICMYAALLLISWFGANMIVGSEMTTGQLTSLLTYAMQILSSLMMLSMIVVMTTIARASAVRTVEILKEESTIRNPENPITQVPNGSISFRNVSFQYAKEAEKAALQDVNLEIHSGETIGIIGGTGSSKTTLVQLIPRLYDVTEGEILVGGINVKDYDMEVLRNEVAVVLQKNVLFSGTIRDNLRWGNPDATDEEIQHACILAQADTFIQTFPQKYDTWIEQGGTNVSGGQRQRLCIARALLKKPKILILDDSTSAVDTKTDALIRRAFAEEIPNTTKLIIAQRISSVQNADRIIVLDGGRVNGFGSHEELMQNNSIYREVYESQIKGGEEK